MARKKHSPALDLVVFLVVRFAIAVIQALPFLIALRCGSLLAWLAYRIDKRHREVARENLRYAFPDLCENPAECDRLVKGCYRHFCTMIIEMIFLPRKMSTSTWTNYALGPGRMVPECMLDGGPMLIVTGHFGNWELAGYVIGLTGFRTYAIARTLDNPYLDRFFKRFRQKTGQTILAKSGEFDQIVEVLAKGGVIATLGDQDAGSRGQFVPFFNRPASTHKAIALMALRFQAKMLVLGVPRVGWPMRYDLAVQDVIDPLEYAHRPDAVKLITERYTASLERLIRRYPEQYFWLHRRWKHQPVRRKAKAA